jgi:rare lipoprotein A
MNKEIVVLALATLLLAACGALPQRKTATPVTIAPAANKTTGAPGGGGYLAGDGPGANIPVNLDAVPDAVPKSEPLHRYANRPYVALGKTYTPMTIGGNYTQRGIASWYGKKFNGERTSSGEIYDMYAMTAAHPTLPLPSYARVTNLTNQKSVIVRINDRGPFMNDRIIDLSYTAAYKLGILGEGSAEVEVESLDPNTSVNTIAANTVQIQALDSSAPASAVAAVPAATTGAPAATPPVALASLVNSDTNVYLQLGAFVSQQNAESFLARMRTELSSTGKLFKLSTTKDGLVRVHIGPYANQSEARSSAESLESKLGFKPMVNLP